MRNGIAEASRALGADVSLRGGSRAIRVILVAIHCGDGKAGVWRVSIPATVREEP